MQEFESISASSYDPSALATKLTAKAADGWSVVAIVPTGGDVTAFLSRDKAGADGAMSATTETANDDRPAEDVAPLVLANNAADGEIKADDVASEPVSEPSGWAIAPEAAAATAAAASTPTLGSTASTATPASQVAAATPAAAAAPVAAAAPAVSAPEPAPAPAVPAGWYADPAGRFELRYWDGTTWTEHVSRAGQQFTDPPVA